MDIIFQSGEFYGETNSIFSNLISIISALLGAIISGLIAIYIFKRGLKNETIKVQKELERECIELEQFFNHNIESLHFFIKHQISSISICSRNTKNWETNDFDLSIFAELNCQDLWHISQEKLYNVFVNRKEGDIKSKAQDFINIRNCLHNIDDFVLRQSEINKEISNRLLVQIDIWNLQLKKLLDYSNLFVHRYNNGLIHSEDPLLKLFIGLFVNKQREIIRDGLNNNMEIVFNELILPLKKYLSENGKSKDEKLYMISGPIMDMQKAFYEIDYLRTERRKKALLAGRKLNAINNLMMTSLANMKSRQYKY